MRQERRIRNHRPRPDASVIMPAWNAAADIEESIRSVMAQTHHALELIVVDDASTDGTREVVERLQKEDARIRLVCNPVNYGVSLARNHGMEHARGRYLMFLDSDDLWEPEKAAVQIAFMRSTGCIVSYMDYLRFRDDEPEHEWQVEAPDTIDHQAMLISNEIGMLTGAIDTVQLKHVPRFQDKGHEDYIFWLEVLKRTAPEPARKVPTARPLAKYRERRGSVSSSYLRSARWHWEVISREEPDTLHRLALMSRYAWRAISKRSSMMSGTAVR
ncbi:MAG TPA: glycosyltransferase family 2 protein [Gammaproteobacteria bacterium]|nr:glycosyltransferase family 2 protein [Gammaproteobacteria bacterium]